MTRLVIQLTELQTRTIDWIMSGEEDYRRDDRHRARAVGQVILDYAEELQERAGQYPAPHASERNAAAPDRHDRTTVPTMITRLKGSRDRYRNLVVRIEAAILGIAPRADFGDIERRLEQALGGIGIRLPARPRPVPTGTRRGGHR
ncbi:MAG: hypothetical protein OXK76_07640 [Gammaproteobacteria bacterium]|nr:hypothetical protein [Gammaproteobacteria bacterium]